MIMPKIFVLILMIIALAFITAQPSFAQEKNTWWKIQSIDTMKYSRDLAREKSKDASFDQVIDQQVSAIAATGATHVAIGTPYDDEFIPFLKKWVFAARKYNLNVWFRGNFSGWEGWFEYQDISREDHLKKTERFIQNNGDLFKSGDIFTACPECENGGPGDPRQTGDVEGFRKFLIDSKKIAVKAFVAQGKKDIETSYFSMNGDVAKLIMDKETTRNLGGVVAVDHYVSTGKKLADDLREYMSLSGGKVILSEFGAPILDIHGQMTQEQQQKWVTDTLSEISKVDGVIGLNYWANLGSSTHLWEDNMAERKAVSALKSYYSPAVIGGNITNQIGQKIAYASVKIDDTEYKTDASGLFTIMYPANPTETEKTLHISASEYISTFQKIDTKNTPDLNIVLEKENEGVFFKIRKFFYTKFLKNIIA
ncbi:MAG: hypothetical protein E6Q58_04830 [Niabella sp.]|nr:MAG: hypothetical protein E6Q58_04830 [Niabella sp.]